MAGNVKCELSSGNPQESGFSGSYANGSRLTHPVASLDRLGSFRENINGRAFSSGASMSKAKASDLPPISLCLTLEPITLGDPRFTRFGELRRALGFSFGNTSEDNSFGAAHSKPAPVLGVDELKRFKGSIQDGSDKARIRVKKLDDSLIKLTAYIRKQQINERSSGSNLLKTGAQSHKKSPDQMTQKMDDKGKNALSKRARTPVAEMRLEGRGTGIPRQHMVLGKDKDISKQGSLSSDSKLPAGGESWDKKMKRKRSVSNVFSRPVECDGEIKRAMHSRVNSDSGLPSSDLPPFRSASSNGIGSNIKSDSTSTASGSSVRPTAKNEMEKVSLSRELGGINKERVLQKGNNKLNMRDENQLVSPSLLTKGKPSRPPRAGPPRLDNSSPTSSHMASTPEDWEQPSNVNKMSLGGINNRKRVFSSESLSPPVAQWVGQRPQKNSRIRRTNIISPTSNNDEAHISSEGFAALEFGAITSSGFNGSFPAWSIANNAQQLKVKSENTPSPARLSESEETSAVENRLKERVVSSVESEERGINGYPHVGSPGLLTKKNKLIVKEDIGDGVRRQGRSGRGSSFSRGGMSPLSEKLDSPAAAKPVRNTKPGSDKNGSKSGRPPLKKHSERKGFTRLGLVPNGNSPDCTGESDDDREDLIAAAQFASSANDHACTSSFWKKMEPVFSSRAYDKSGLKQQLKPLEEHQGSPSQMFASGSVMKDVLKEEKLQPRSFGYQGEIAMSSGVEPANTEGRIEWGQESDFNYKRETEEEPKSITPLYKRVLSALIMEDDFEEFEKSNCGRNPALFGIREVACSMEEKISNGDCSFTAYNSCSNNDIPSQLDLWEGDCSFMHSEAGILPASSQNNLKGPVTPRINISTDSSFQAQYAQMSMDEKLLIELQSIGLYPETVPDLDEGEDELFSEEISQLESLFCQKAQKKKLCLERIWKPVEEEKDVEERVVEQVAVNRLTELAYRKLLATRGSTAARIGVSKVPRHVALAFVKRTLARCRKFEDTGKSCFSEPALRDVILAGPSSSGNAESVKPIGLPDHLQSEAKPQGSNPTGTERGVVEILDRGKKKEVLLDDVGNGAAAFKPSPLGNPLMGGAKGKRSERDREKDLASRNPNAKSGRPSITNLRGERKAKSKPKQKAAHLSTHPVFPSASGSANGSRRKAEDPASPVDSSEEGKDQADLTNLPLSEIESIGLVDDNALGGNQDLSSWLNFDEDNLQDHDSMGLEIPMDDLSELNMLL